jgi:hypothetical protein
MSRTKVVSVVDTVCNNYVFSLCLQRLVQDIVLSRIFWVSVTDTMIISCSKHLVIYFILILENSWEMHRCLETLKGNNHK